MQAPEPGAEPSGEGQLRGAPSASAKRRITRCNYRTVRCLTISDSSPKTMLRPVVQSDYRVVILALHNPSQTA